MRFQPGRLKSGPREDLGDARFRSGWEASVARWFNHQGIVWEYEPVRFRFLNIKRGTRGYTPDFYLPELDLYVEVKGNLPAQDKTRMRRFRKNFPDEFAKLRVIPGSAKTEAARFFEEMGVPAMAYFRELNKEFKDIIEHWDE